jgi:hypothetical protein
MLVVNPAQQRLEAWVSQKGVARWSSLSGLGGLKRLSLGGRLVKDP